LSRGKPTSTGTINFNGKLLPATTAIIGADNRGFRYGDGLFETLKVKNGRIALGDYHFERLFTGIRLLQFQPSSLFTAGALADQVLELCKKNGHSALARVRLAVFRGDGGLYDPTDHLPNYLIQTWDLAETSPGLNSNGLVIGVFPDGRKACDPFANLKSNNFLLYALAALHARDRNWNDCLVLNQFGRIADSTIANLFYCKEGIIYTPPLTEGCVAGVMRRYLLETLPGAGFQVMEKETDMAGLQEADEVFLTNALRGIRWVASFGETVYGHTLITSISEKIII
jgi:branched-chain amino acid aminotransferase